MTDLYSTDTQSINQDVKTVAGELDSALSQILGTEIVTTCAGRTDRGVHAQGQVISFDAPEGTDLLKLQHSVNRICRPWIVVTEFNETSSEFDARFSANGRTYRYRILNQKTPDPFLTSTTKPTRPSPLLSLIGSYYFLCSL